jgi:hypothetical protein
MINIRIEQHRWVVVSEYDIEVKLQKSSSMKYFATLNLKDYILSKKREARVSEMRVTIEKR